MGRNALISFHKFRSKLVIQTEAASPSKGKDKAPKAEETKKTLRKEREPKATINSDPVVPILVKRIAKFTGVQPATRE